MKKSLVFLTLAFLVTGGAVWAQDLTGVDLSGEKLAQGQDIHFMNEKGGLDRGVRCDTKDQSPDKMAAVRAEVDSWLEANGGFTKAATQIPVAFHVVYKQKKGVTTGDVSNSQVQDQIDVLNAAYAGTGFSFYLASLDYTKNNKWFNRCGTTSQEKKMKQALNIDPANNLNIYTCNPSGGILAGHLRPLLKVR